MQCQIFGKIYSGSRSNFLKLPSEVDAAGGKAQVVGDEMGVMVKWILSTCSMICFS